MKTLRSVLVVGMLTFCAVVLASNRDQEQKFQQAIHLMETKGDYPAAIRLFEEVAKGPDRSLAARSLLYIGICYEKLGKTEARKAYERVVREFGDQHQVAAEARTRLQALTRAVPAAATPAMTVRQLWAGPTVDFLGVPSADGRYLPITDWETGDLGIRNLVAGETRRLTSKGSWMQSSEFALFPILSPDGKQIVYGWFNTEWTWDLRIIGTDGSAPRVLYQSQDVDFVFPGGWTPDGKHIAASIARRDRTAQIGLVSAADGSFRVLKTFPPWPGGPSRIGLSPDGRHIAYDLVQKEGSRETDIFLLSVETKQENPLVRHPANDFAPIWTPDAKNILFASDRTGTLGLWLQEVVDGKPEGAPELVKPDVGHIWLMGFTQNGALYYGLDTGMNDVYVTALDVKAAKVAEAPVPLSQRYVGSNSAPAWSPDGKYIAYGSQRGPGTTSLASRDKVMVIRSVDTGQERDIAVDLSTVLQPIWSPDSRSILVSGQDRKQRSGIFQIEVQSGELTTLVQEEGNNYRSPDLSPDGKTLFYLQINFPKKAWSIRARDLASGTEKELYGALSPAAHIGSLGLSPGGQQLAFVLADQAKAVLKVMPTTAGEARDICQIQRPAYLTGNTRLIWTPDGQKILFLRGEQDPVKPQDQTYELWQVSAAGGEPQKLGLTMERLRDLSLHPDGRRLAFSAGQTKPEVWVMENFLPEDDKVQK